MLSTPNRIISNIYRGSRLTVVPVFASVLSLIVSFAMYGGTVASGMSAIPLWFSAWIVSLPFMVLPALIMIFVRDKGIYTSISFVGVMVTMTVFAYLVYYYGIPEESVSPKRVCAGLLICTIPYLISCIVSVAVCYAVNPRKREADTAGTGRYSSLKMDFLSERGKVELSITSDRLLYIETESNYLTVVYLDRGPKGEDRVATRKIRSSLKSVEARFKKVPMIKANRSCVVNSERVDYVVREGRGGMLKLHGYDTMLKISQQNYGAFSRYAERSHEEFLKERHTS